MNRKLRTEILIKSNSVLAKGLANEIELKYKVVKVEEPNNGLVMVKMRETAKKHLFYLGETLVTETKVLINGSMGLGIIAGNEPEFSYYLAVIDAAYNANLPETLGWSKIFEDALDELRRLSIEENYKILRTRVDFETMQEELSQ